MKISRYWLALAVTALGLSGIFTILLIIGRTTNLLPQGFFAPALIVHVNLDVLVWLLATTVSYFNTSKTRSSPVPFFAAAFGTALITLSPFIGTGEAYTNNYIPIFDNTLFKSGIALFLGAVAFESITTLLSTKTSYITKTTAYLIVAAFAAFAASYASIQEKTSSHYLYEYLFWGGGHILQFVYVQIMLTAWLLLAEKAGVKLIPHTKTNDKLIRIIFALPLIVVTLASICIYTTTSVETTDHVQRFTSLMVYGTGIAALPLGLLMFVALLINFRFRLYHITLGLSLLLFAIGGALGQVAAKAVAQGNITTIIPAHYHFSSVAVTVALMGYIYSRLNLQKTKLAIWQITLYTIGQICYFSGMAIFGGHGAARKTAGVDTIQMDEGTKKTVEHIMHGGGSLSLIGGVLFVVIVIKAWKNKPSAS